jgi:hypothetical protein
MNKTQTTEQTNTQHLKPITRNDLAQNTGFENVFMSIAADKTNLNYVNQN